MKEIKHPAKYTDSFICIFAEILKDQKKDSRSICWNGENCSNKGFRILWRNICKRN